MRKSLTIFSLTLAHASLSTGAFVLAFSAGMARFDTLRAPTVFEKVLDIFVLIMHFPLVHIAHLAPRGWFPGLWGHVPVFFNSAIWAVVLTYAYLWLRDRSA